MTTPSPDGPEPLQIMMMIKRLSSKPLLSVTFAALLAAYTPAARAQNTYTYHFDMRPGQPKAGWIAVKPDQAYNGSYGFDMGTVVKAVAHPGKKVSGAVTSDQPFYFSASVPEGNYRITLTLGDQEQSSNTTVKAESRRLMLENVVTKPGEFKIISFMVNVRKPQISGGDSVRLKPREVGKLDWDDKLTLEFDGKTFLNTLEIQKVTDQITVYLAGNSTVVDQDDEPWAAWGQMIPRFFKQGVAVANHAESGLTLGSFMGSKRLDKVMSLIRPGDYLFIEFGHNDQKEKGPNDGPWRSYAERLKTYIARTRQKGAIPVIVTSTARRSFDAEGRTVNTLGEYPDAARKVARDEGVTLIDLNAMTTRFYDALGVEPSKKALVHYPANTFPGQTKAFEDNTHFNPYGAYELAKCVAQGIRTSDLALKEYLVDMPAFDPSHPDALDSFNWPLSPKNSTIKPDGN
ncbi:rhamnogalacturonan acetylesterase [Mucilaginibacter daejeonensis]|uniref:rhamnogalacturonan acetylesterase n=1 Tax=Mucilaginibacter daejeonensis TaxID=398049 RepID=UPI001D172019|nr:rhamnogalacturonan acetylesterase [Mucilaginibacter daejeonensis]UEG53849.1 rhamnogalacturonan acetylesterase [Mucilaginibacter daejeonensis]